MSKTLDGRRDLLAPAAAFPTRYAGLLQSAVRGTHQARYVSWGVHTDDTVRLWVDGAPVTAERSLSVFRRSSPRMLPRG